MSKVATVVLPSGPYVEVPPSPRVLLTATDLVNFSSSPSGFLALPLSSPAVMLSSNSGLAKLRFLSAPVVRYD